jgi:hypothetical protein
MRKQEEASRFPTRGQAEWRTKKLNRESEHNPRATSDIWCGP